MEFYWRLEDIPELRSLSKAEQTEVWYATLGRRLRDPVVMWLLVPYFLIVAAGNYLGGLLLPWRFGSAIGGGIGAGAALAMLLIVSYNRCRPYLAEEARRRTRAGETRDLPG